MRSNPRLPELDVFVRTEDELRSLWNRANFRLEGRQWQYLLWAACEFDHVGHKMQLFRPLRLRNGIDAVRMFV